MYSGTVSTLVKLSMCKYYYRINDSRPQNDIVELVCSHIQSNLTRILSSSCQTYMVTTGRWSPNCDPFEGGWPWDWWVRALFWGARSMAPGYTLSQSPCTALAVGICICRAKRLPVAFGKRWKLPPVTWVHNPLRPRQPQLISRPSNHTRDTYQLDAIGHFY